MSGIFPFNTILILYYVALLRWVARIGESLWWLYYGMDGRGILVRFPAEAKIYLSLNCPDGPWNLPNLLVSGNLGHTLEVRRATEHLEVKNHWSYTSTPPRTYAACTVQGKLLCMSPDEQRLWCKQLIDINWNHSACCRRACVMGNTIYNKWLWRHKWEFSSTVHTIHCVWYRSASFWPLLQYQGSLSNDALGKSGSVASNGCWWQMNTKGASGIQVKRRTTSGASFAPFHLRTLAWT